MPANPEAFADMVVMTVKTALVPILERMAALDQVNKDLQARLADLSGVRDRVTAVETKAAMPMAPIVTGPTAAEIEILVRDRVAPLVKAIDGMEVRLAAAEAKPEPVVTAPVVSGPTAAEAELALRDRIEPLTKQIAALSERVAVIEVKAPVSGPAGPAGKDGLNGKDGADGMGWDDLSVQHDGERTFTLKMARGERVKDAGVFTLPVDIYRGVYIEGKTYERGDGVTWGGSEWHCNESTTSKPGEGSKAWTLKVKRGRDGKDGRDAATVPVVSIGGAR